MNTKCFNALVATSTLAGVILATGSANAASLGYSAAIAYQPTDFTSLLSVQKFDSSLGTLDSVVLDFIADITGSSKFENLGNSQSSPTVDLSSNVSLSLNNQTLLSLNPANVTTYQVTGFDNSLDFGGSSGKTINSIGDTKSGTQTLTSNLQSFIGTGNVDFLLSAISGSKVTGSGNIISQIQTNAKGSLAVTYNYTPTKSVPEPSAMLGIGLIAGFGLLSQGKKSWLKISKQ